MLVRRFKRLVMLVGPIFVVAVFIVSLHSGRKEPAIWGMALAARSLDLNSPDTVLAVHAIPQIHDSLTKQLTEVRVDELEEAADADEMEDEEEWTFEDYDDFEDSTDTDDGSKAKREDGDLEENSVVEEINDHSSDIDTEDEDGDYNPLPESKDYREIFSLTTKDRKFFAIYLGGDAAYNPSLIPHPTRHDLWIVLTQHEQSRAEVRLPKEALVCNAGFYNGVLVCTGPPTILPVNNLVEGKCEGLIAHYNLRSGPRDARMFYGPDAPYIVYGSQSLYGCLGMWLQDIRMLLQDFRLEQMTLVKLFKRAFEIQRPPPRGEVEKNFFLFWDSEGKTYVHHDVFPKRVFAQLSYDGSVGPDLALDSSTKDGICMAKYMPAVRSIDESIHQATNSLSITLCRRLDPFCVPSDSNTFIMTIFHHKSYYEWHSVYEPYVMLFQRSAPFAVHAISQRPLWIHGRGMLTKDTRAVAYDADSGRELPVGHSEMFYITSMSWKTHGQRYHGYIDDPLFLAFGIEDSRPAAIDVLAGDLLQDLGLCAH